jgi:hypothetical protein
VQYLTPNLGNWRTWLTVTRTVVVRQNGWHDGHVSSRARIVLRLLKGTFGRAQSTSNEWCLGYSVVGAVALRNVSPLVLLFVFGSACASSGASESFVAQSGAGLGRQQKEYTAIATAVPVAPDSAYQLLTRVYAMLEIPSAPVDRKRSVGNDDLKVRRHIAGLPMQDVVDCGEKLGLQNAETWEIDMNLVSDATRDREIIGARA